MRVYLAGIYHGRRARPGSGSIHLRVTEAVNYPDVLESFHYANDRMAQAIRRNGQQIFLDSGAFSAFSQGIRISRWQYARFIRDNRDLIEIAANLDVIDRGQEQHNHDNLRMLQQLLRQDGLQHLIKPVHHLRDADYWLERYLDEGYDFICLGGLVRESTRIQQRWLDHVWHKFLANPDGTPKVRVHGFGLTNALMFRYPWASVDSTRWTVSCFGGVLMDFEFQDGSIGDYTICFSERSEMRFNPNSWHYNSLSRVDRSKVDRRLEQLEAERISDPEIETAFKEEFGCRMGFNPTALSKCYGLRDLCNIAYFRRVSKRGIDNFGGRP